MAQVMRAVESDVRFKDGSHNSLVNETYSMMRFDAMERVDPAPAPTAAQTSAASPKDPACPSVAERTQMVELLFGATGSPPSPCAASAVN